MYCDEAKYRLEKMARYHMLSTQQLPVAAN